jgi:hypothetical protein
VMILEYRALRKIYGPKRKNIPWCWVKKVHEVLYDLYSLPSIILVIKSRGMRWAGHVAFMGGVRKTCT